MGVPAVCRDGAGGGGAVMGQLLQLAWPDLLAELRWLRGWSQADLSQRAGVDPSYITRLEDGQRQPSAQTVAALARALDLESTAQDVFYLAAGLAPPHWRDRYLIGTPARRYHTGRGKAREPRTLKAVG